MQTLDQSGSMAESAFRIVRVFLEFLIFLVAVAASRWGIRTFLLNRGGRSERWRIRFSAANVVVLVLLLLLRGPADKLLTTIGDAIARLRPEPELVWVTGMLAGVYDALIASSILLLAIYGVGLTYWFADQRIAGRQAKFPASVSESDPRFHASRTFGFVSVCSVT